MTRHARFDDPDLDRAAHCRAVVAGTATLDTNEKIAMIAELAIKPTEMLAHSEAWLCRRWLAQHDR